MFGKDKKISVKTKMIIKRIGVVISVVMLALCVIAIVVFGGLLFLDWITPNNINYD